MEIENQKQVQEKSSDLSIPIEIIERKIYMIRGKKVMFDSDLAKLYGVATKVLNQAARRNAARFPPDFMFQLSDEEVETLRSQIVTSNTQVSIIKGVKLRFQFGTSKKGRGGRQYLPYAFTEQGVAMLSSVLRSERAVQVNIQIMRTFTRLRELLASNEMLRQKIEEVEKKYDQQFQVVFEAIKKLIEPSPEESKPKRRIGFHAGQKMEFPSGRRKSKQHAEKLQTCSI